MEINFTDIVDRDKWQEIQDRFSEVLKVTLFTVDRYGNCITRCSLAPRLCQEVMTITIESAKVCSDCHRRVLVNAEKSWKEGYLCPIGLYFFPVPLKIKEVTLGYLIVGPVVLGKRDESTYKERIENLGIDIDIFLDALREIKVFSFYGIKSVIELLYDLSVQILSTNFIVDKFLTVLLEAAHNFTQSDRSSIMLFNEDTKELYIKVAKGIEEDIIASTRLKLGEGLAGIAAQQDTPLFLSNDTVDENIRKRFRNRAITYSIIMPIKVQNKLLGILNIATYKQNSDKFNFQNIDTITKLKNLVESTLGEVT
ncbi:MAG: PocR ligand-binding domain-containing protein [Candidatus Omnitrophica bacterium]|nr:PocR ligand-binding domain-containing protein [Candidatus Omnitrophota bacterium]MCM8826574.1 PocR ligand-binding domain-containing protein [Candidatus Omnitrophota bacterium]